MKLFYYRRPDGLNNFGDALNPWLWERSLPGFFDNDDSTAFIGIGTLLNNQLPRRVGEAQKSIVFSTGAGYEKKLTALPENFQIICVRGKLTARQLGLPETIAVTDGAILVRRFFQPTGDKKSAFAFMPQLNLLPVGTDGFHGTAAQLDALSTSSLNRPTENLILKAQTLGYTVVYTEQQLRNLLDPTLTPVTPKKVLGVFAPIHTFNDRPEEVLAANGLPLYVPTAPTIAEMLELTQKLMEKHPNFGNGSITILEEEGTDNFGNNNNAAGTLEGLRRADAAIGVAMDFVEKYSNTLVITAADSDAGGLEIVDRAPGQM